MQFQSTLSVRRATLLNTSIAVFVLIFQSTLSVRRATEYLIWLSYINFHFNPRSPWGERLPFLYFPLCHFLRFQSTLSVRRATVFAYYRIFAHNISIHALREESDTQNQNLQNFAKVNFNPRSPWGERQSQLICWEPGKYNFNPRSPWGERPR